MKFKETEYYDEIFENINLQEEILESKEFDNCTFKNCIFAETTFQYCKFITCSFENCDLSLLKVKSSVFNDVRIKECKAIGIDWSLCDKLFAVTFDSSNINMSSFYSVNLIHSKIISCLANEVDFSQSNLEVVDFQDTDLLHSTFNNTNLKCTDLSMARNYLIDPEFNNLKKTKVSIHEATSFLQFLDLDIVD